MCPQKCNGCLTEETLFQKDLRWLQLSQSVLGLELSLVKLASSSLLVSNLPCPSSGAEEAQLQLHQHSGPLPNTSCSQDLDPFRRPVPHQAWKQRTHQDRQRRAEVQTRVQLQSSLCFQISANWGKSPAGSEDFPRRKQTRAAPGARQWELMRSAP